VSAWSKKGHIIGILTDYKTNFLHERIRPIIVDVKEYEQFGVILVRTEAGKTQQALSSAEKIYKSLNPNYPFDFCFVDEEYNKMYRSEQVIARLSEVFSVLAILISCLGLLGLVMFTAEQRVKEIGIRKVLGATVINIVGLLSKDFLKLVAFSFLVAAPIAGYIMYRWLQGFAYQIELSWWIFVLAGVATLLVALVTISVQALQSAAVSPVQSLKAEG
ncbi:MAG: ABC transporter permease, partial [Bacteroidota bacterium]